MMRKSSQSFLPFKQKINSSCVNANLTSESTSLHPNYQIIDLKLITSKTTLHYYITVKFVEKHPIIIKLTKILRR